MNHRMSIPYYDRKTGLLKNEEIYGEGFLYWAYNTRSGRLFTDLIFRQKFFSQAYGWLHKQPLSKRKIQPFVKAMKVDLAESVRPLEDFKSFNDFFTREIDLSKRPIDPNPGVCIASVDGKILAYPVVDPDMTFRIKRNTFNLRKFLCKDELTEKFAGGSMVVSRLCLIDYHHFHFPDSGIPHEAVSIKGKYHAGGSYGLHRLVPFYTENYRMVTLFDSDHFGQIALVEIGAFTVGSFQQRYKAGVPVAKGARKGFFELGGSTVVQLFQRGRIELDEDLVANTQKGIETYVCLGDSIGRMPGSRRSKSVVVNPKP